jgi:hypothetical protein
VHLGGREDELHVRRRLFESLQERVPRRIREHVDLVHDVDLEAITGGPEREALLESADLVDAVVAGAVDLLDVHVDAGGDLRARRARLAGRGGRSRRGVAVLGVRAEAVEALGEDARAGGLADPANASEEERMRDAALRDRVGERLRDVLLTDQVLEGLRPVLASENEIAHAGSR